MGGRGVWGSPSPTLNGVPKGIPGQSGRLGTSEELMCGPKGNQRLTLHLYGEQLRYAARPRIPNAVPKSDPTSLCGDTGRHWMTKDPKCGPKGTQKLTLHLHGETVGYGGPPRIPNAVPKADPISPWGTIGIWWNTKDPKCGPKGTQKLTVHHHGETLGHAGTPRIPKDPKI